MIFVYQITLLTIPVMFKSYFYFLFLYTVFKPYYTTEKTKLENERNTYYPRHLIY